MSASTGTNGYSTYDILFVRSNISGGVLVGVFYGIVLVFYVFCMQALWRARRKLENANLFMAHSTCVFILNTLYTASTSRVLELTYVDNDGFSGGPLAYLNLEFFIPINVLGAVVFLIANWLLDALMLWRCAVIWSGPYAKYIIILPSLILIGSFVSGTLLLIVTCQPSTSLWSNAGVSVALPYYILSLSLNIILTFLIVLRLVLYRRKFRITFGKYHVEPYTSLAAFIVESAAPYSILSAVYLVLVAINNPIQQVFLGILSGAQIVASYLIILRVARGDAWKPNTSTTFSSTLSAVDVTNGSTVYTIQNASKLDEIVNFRSTEDSFATSSTSQVEKIDDQV